MKDNLKFTQENDIEFPLVSDSSKVIKKSYESLPWFRYLLTYQLNPQQMSLRKYQRKTLYLHRIKLQFGISYEVHPPRVEIFIILRVLAGHPQ